ncbi:MAG: 7TM-DISM domain-containing protein [Saprospiraceae bacterium]
MQYSRAFIRAMFSVFFVSISLVMYSKNELTWANNQLKNSIMTYEDKEGNKSPESMMQLPESEFNPGNIHLNFGFTTSTWWVKFTLKNETSDPASMLLNLSNGHIHDIRYYTSDSQIKPIITGNHYSFSTRPYKFTEYLFPIKLNPQETSSYYLRLEKKGGELNAPLQILSDHFDYVSQFNRWNLFFGSTFLYILILFITVCIIRSRVILYYFIYACCLCIYMASVKGITFSALWPEQIWVQTNVLELSKHLANIFYILFVLKFIGWNPANAAINAFLKSSMIICGLNILCRLIYSWTGWIPDSFMMRFVQLTALILPIADVCLIYLLYQSWKLNKKPEVMWLLLITAGLFIPLAFLVSLHFGWIPALPVYPNLLVIMFLIEIICISIIIIYRYYELYTKEIHHLREITTLRKKAVENILLGQEEERIRIAKDLHDGISLSLASIRMRLSSLENKIEPGVQKNLVTDLISQIGNTSHEVRSISHNLAPLSLQHQELTKAIEELVYQIELVDSNMDIEFNYSPDINKSLSAILKQNIYQTVKELFNNILKYAKATQIKVRLVHEKDQLQLEVEDNGMIYDYNKSIGNGNGVGLASIQSRATLLNGKFDAFPRKDGGMLHLFSIPYSA